MPRPPLYLAPCFFLLLPGLWADTEAGQAAYLKQDWPTALREFQAGVKSGEVEALFWMGVFYSTDHPSYPRDPYRAFAYTLQAAERGHPIAEWLVADAYERGDGVEPNHPESIRWLQLAVEDGVPKDSEKASLLLLAGQPNDARAKYRPDTIRTAQARDALARGDLDAAFAQFTRLAGRGVASAQLNLGFLYLQGSGTRKDPAEAVRWLGRASEHDQVAAYSLAVLYLRGEVVPKNIPRAVTLLKRALGSYDMIHAYYLLATVYGRGYLGRPDHKQAVDTLQSIPPNSWTSPPREPLPDLPLLQLLPPVEIGNRAEQRNWFAQAGRSGHLASQLKLGFEYELGVSSGPSEDLVPKDLARAYYWYSLAAAQGDAQAKQLFDRVARAISPADLQRARRLASLTRSTRKQTSSSPPRSPHTASR